MPETKHQRANRKWDEYVKKHDPQAFRKLQQHRKQTAAYEHPAKARAEEAKRRYGCSAKGINR